MYTKLSLAAAGLGLLAAALIALQAWLEYSRTRAQFPSDQIQGSDPFTALLMIGLGGPVICLVASVVGGWGRVNRIGAAGALFAVGAGTLWTIAWRATLPGDLGWSLLAFAGGIAAVAAGALLAISKPPERLQGRDIVSNPQPPAEGSPAIIELDSRAPK